MKQETNKEMELMLRRLARRSSNDLAGNKEHLDADELNAYAEHALPPAARARYTEHLADCARCREIVVGLSASLGQPVVAKVKTPEQRSSLKNFLATLLSPMFARYAIPTLAVIGIVGIAFIAFRDRPASKNLATAPSVQRESADQVAQANQPQSNAGFIHDDQQGAKNDSTQGAKTAGRVSKDTAPAKAGKPETVTVDDAPPPPPVAEPKVAKLAEAEGAAGRREDADQKRPATAEREEQPADEAKRGRDKEVAKKEDDRTTTEFRPKTTVARASDVNKNEVAKSRSAPAPAAGASGTFQRQEQEKRKDAEEVRTVAGRRFQREGNTWVDTAYERGRDTMNVARGSERYRALIADEPEIRTIAETLSGEVVVIWKGRAYRIR